MIIRTNVTIINVENVCHIFFIPLSKYQLTYGWVWKQFDEYKRFFNTFSNENPMAFNIAK